MLQNARLLYGKGLYNQSLKMLSKASQLADQYERYAELLQILDLEKKILLDKNIEKAEKRFEVISDRFKRTITNQAQLIELELIKVEVYMIHKQYVKSPSTVLQNKVNELVRHVETLPAATAGFRYTLVYLNLHVLHALVSGNYELLRASYDKMLAHWKQRPDFIEEETPEYRKHLCNYLSHCHVAGDISTFENVLSEINSLPAPDNIDDEASLFKNVPFLELLYYINTDRFEEGRKLVTDIEYGLKKYKLHISDSRALSFHHNIINLYLFDGQPQEAYKWIQRVINYPKTESRKDIQNIARVLQILVHYDLGNHDLVDYQLQSVPKYLQRKGDFGILEKEFFKGMRRVLSATGRDEIQNAFASFSADLELLTKAPQQTPAFGLSEIYLWVKAKELHLPVRTVLLQMNQTPVPEL
jgi:hypothetical protein